MSNTHFLYETTPYCPGKLTQEEWLSVLNSSGVPTTKEEVG